MRGPRSLALLGLMFVGLFGLAACQRETTPPLVQVLALSPRLVEKGDRIEIDGVGFPEGKSARVSFRGDLHRPGMPVVRGVEIDVDAVAASSTEVDVPVSETLATLFAGAGDRAAHTTFSGDVTVAFAAVRPAAPPVAGTLHDTWLDVRPPTSVGAAALAEAAEGARTLAFLGIKPQSAPLPAGGVLIDSIEPGSRAESARLLAGDVVTELDGLRVLSVRDLIAVPGERAAWLRIRRGGNPHEEVAEVSLLGLRPPPATALLYPVLVLGLAAVLLLLFFAPTPGAVAWVERHVSSRIRARARLEPRHRFARLFGSPFASSLAFFGASATFVLLPFVHYLGVGEIDVGILLVLALTALATLGLVTGGSRSGQSYSLFGGLRTAARVLSLGIPTALGVVAVVMMTGSLRLEDIVRCQSGAPWGWMLFKSPLTLGLLALSLLTELVDGGESTRPPLFFFAEWVGLFVKCAVLAAIFLGGWRVPGLAAEQVEAHLAWTLVGASLFAAKTWLLVFAVVSARWALPPLRVEEAMSVCWRCFVPLSLVLLLLTAVWVAWGPGPSAETLVGAVMLAVTAAAGLHFVRHVRYFVRETTRDIEPLL